MTMVGKTAGNMRGIRTMLRLLGLLSLGHLIFGGRRRRFGRGLLLGALLGYLANRHFDAGRVAEDVREKARKAERAAREAVRAARRELQKEEHDRKAAAIHERIDARRAEREERLNAIRAEHEARMNAIHAEIEARKARRAETRKEENRAEETRSEVRALPVSGTNEAKEIRELAEGLERDARTAAMAANVPTIDFPDEDGKYDSARKYGYAQ